MTLISFTLLDDDGDTSTVPVHVQDGETFDNYELGAVALAELIDAITGCQVTSINLNVGIDLPGTIKANPVANIETQKGANFLFGTEGRYNHGIRVPGLLPTLFVQDAVNLADGDVTAFTDAIVDGTGALLGELVPHNGHEEDLTSIIRGVKSFRKR